MNGATGEGRRRQRAEAAAIELATRIGHTFADPSLLEEALTHRSALDRQRTRKLTFPFGNERLEFLGDRVLSLVVADMVLRQFPDEAEGELARRHTALVRAEALGDVARAIGLGTYLRLGDSERATGGETKLTILADACEALIGAIYRDGGLAAARAFVERHWAPFLNSDPQPPRDPKTALQEWAQGRGLPVPSYREVGREGPPHKPRFVIEATVEGLAPERGTGGSKREAERAAAQVLLARLEAGGAPA
jgi:ribonuclease-3